MRPDSRPRTLFSTFMGIRPDGGTAGRPYRPSGPQDLLNRPPAGVERRRRGTPVVERPEPDNGHRDFVSKRLDSPLVHSSRGVELTTLERQDLRPPVGPTTKYREILAGTVVRALNEGRKARRTCRRDSRGGTRKRRRPGATDPAEEGDLRPGETPE